MGTTNLSRQEAAQQEIAGMRAAAWYVDRRDAIRSMQLTAIEVRRIGDLLHEYWVQRGRADFANGWREMCYIISQGRGNNGTM